MSETDSQRAAWDAARVGSPSPSLDYDGPPCAAMGPWSFGCTRARGHSGQHVATAGGEVAVVWSAGYYDPRSRATVADAYAHAAGMAQAASLNFTLIGDKGPEWIRREVVLELAERLAALAREAT